MKLPTLLDFSDETSLVERKPARKKSLKSLFDHGFVSSLVNEHETRQQHQSLFHVSRKRHRPKEY